MKYILRKKLILKKKKNTFKWYSRLWAIQPNSGFGIKLDKIKSNRNRPILILAPIKKPGSKNQNEKGIHQQDERYRRSFGYIYIYMYQDERESEL